MKRSVLMISMLSLGFFAFACSADDALSLCSPGQQKCADNSLVSCMDNGVWGAGVACVAPNALCDASTYTCVAEVPKCIKDEVICNGNTLLTCLDDGTWNAGVECSGKAPRCDAQLKQCVVIDKVCVKDESKCDGNVLHICQLDGTWGVGVECIGATPICDAKLKQCIKDEVEICVKDESKCDDNVLHICQLDGTWDAGVECADATPICDAKLKQCVKDEVEICVKGESKCDDNVLHICLADGTWDAGLACQNPTPVCDAATQTCVKGPACTTNDKKCIGNILYTCKRNGAWDTGLECKGATPICDAIKLECVQADVCKVEEDCKDLATTCIDTACLKIGLKALSGPDAIQVNTDVEFVLTLNAKVRKTEGLSVLLTADKKEVSINGVSQKTDVVIPKGQDQAILKIKVNPNLGSLSRSYTLTATYDGATVDARFNIKSSAPVCVGNMISIDGKEPINCSEGQVCVKGTCVDFELISIAPAASEKLSFDKDYILTVTANAPARKDVQITPTTDGMSVQMRSFVLRQGDESVKLSAHTNNSFEAIKRQATITLRYNDNMNVVRQLKQTYALINCINDETKCDGDASVFICRGSRWGKGSDCAKSEVCLPSTQACGRNTLRSISPYFALIRARQEHTLTLWLDAASRIDTTLFLKTSSDDLSCKPVVIKSGDDFGVTICVTKNDAKLGQLITIDVYDNEAMAGKSLGKAMVWLSSMTFGF